MTVLYDPLRQQIFTDQPVFPLQFAGRGLVEMTVLDTPAAQAAIAGVAAVHHRVDGRCAECATWWPCTTHRLVAEVVA